MAKSKSFGLVLAKQLSKLILVFVFLSGCVAQSTMSSVEAAKQWDKRYDECTDIAESNKLDFPVTPWFASLSLKEKRSVIGYLYNYNQDICTSKAIDDLRAAIKRDGNEKIKFEYKEVLTPLDELSASRMEGLDKAEILKIQQEFSKPFSIRHVLTTLNLYTN